MNDARYPNISAIDNRLAELENEKQQLLTLREALRSAQTSVQYRHSHQNKRSPYSDNDFVDERISLPIVGKINRAAVAIP